MPTPAPGAKMGTSLSRRENQLMILISDGHTLRQAAISMGLAHQTIKNMTVNLRARLGAKNNPHAVKIWLTKSLDNHKDSVLE